MNPFELTDSEWEYRKDVIKSMRCIACGGTYGVVPHHEPNGCHKNDRRVVPLCFYCHAARHSPSPSDTKFSQIIRRSSAEIAIELDAVFMLIKIIEGVDKC